MGLMPDIINSINVYGCLGGGTTISFETLNTKLDLIMASLQQLSAEVGGLRTEVTGLRADVGTLQTAIDTHQEKVNAALTRLDATVQQLRDQIANGATPEQLQGITDEVIAIRSDIAASKDALTAANNDLQSTPIPEETTNPGTGGEGTPVEPGNTEGTNTGSL